MFPATALRRPRVSVSATSARKLDTSRPLAPTKSSHSWIDRLLYRASARIARPGGTLFPLSRVIGDDLKFFPNLWLNRALVHEACSEWPSFRFTLRFNRCPIDIEISVIETAVYYLPIPGVDRKIYFRSRQTSGWLVGKCDGNFLYAIQKKVQFSFFSFFFLTTLSY